MTGGKGGAGMTGVCYSQKGFMMSPSWYRSSILARGGRMFWNVMPFFCLAVVIHSIRAHAAINANPLVASVRCLRATPNFATMRLLRAAKSSATGCGCSCAAAEKVSEKVNAAANVKAAARCIICGLRFQCCRLCFHCRGLHFHCRSLRFQYCALSNNNLPIYTAATPEGYYCLPTAGGVAQATTRTVVKGSLAVLALNFVLTAFMVE